MHNIYCIASLDTHVWFLCDINILWQWSIHSLSIAKVLIFCYTTPLANLINVPL